MTFLGPMTRSASISSCGTYRWLLVRRWDDRPMLLVVMFNPSTADDRVDDPTITLLCKIASHNGYGGITVVNALPLRSARPADALAMLGWLEARDWHARDRLHENLAVVAREVKRAGAVLLAWGALGDRCSDWMETVLEEIDVATDRGAGDPVPVFCLGRTKAGNPKHPMARGKHKVPPTAQLIPWRDVE